MDKKIQFLLLSDGISHQKMGLDQVKALRQLGCNVACYFPKRKINELIENPDYVLVLKPNATNSYELIKKFKDKGCKIGFMVSDERYSSEMMKLFDFFLSISLDWQEDFLKKYPDKPCYLMKEEYDIHLRKIHKPDSFRIVTMGYAQCLKFYLKPILEQLKDKYKNNIHILTNWKDVPEVYNFCEGFNRDKFDISIDNMMDDDFDKSRITQYNRYDVGLVGLFDIKRPSNRLKSLMYAGLPIVTIKTKNHSNVWFNEASPTIIYVKNNDWRSAIDSLRDYNRRQAITDHNYFLVQRNGGLEKAGEAILKAIERYEKEFKL